jgi:hypothetical protein
MVSRFVVLMTLCACGSDTFTLSDAGSGDGASADVASDAPVGEPKRIFLTSHGFTPGSDFHGLIEADLACNNAAKAGTLPGKYMAWLSDAVASPATRFIRSRGPYVLPDGITVVADNWTGLTTLDLKHAINMTEYGKPAPPAMNGSCQKIGSPMPWTGTDPDGTLVASGNTCNNWSSSSGGETGVAGNSGVNAAPDWSNEEKNCTPSCNNTLPLICVQQ